MYQIKTADGWRPLLPPMQPTPAVERWWNFPMVAAHYVADEREGIEIILEDAKRGEQRSMARELGEVPHHKWAGTRNNTRHRGANPASASYNLPIDMAQRL